MFNSNRIIGINNPFIISAKYQNNKKQMKKIIDALKIGNKSSRRQGLKMPVITGNS